MAVLFGRGYVGKLDDIGLRVGGKIHSAKSHLKGLFRHGRNLSATSVGQMESRLRADAYRQKSASNKIMGRGIPSSQSNRPRPNPIVFSLALDRELLCAPLSGKAARAE
jgi:hypothetical protein